jgi:hypothetical protein
MSKRHLLLTTAAAAALVGAMTASAMAFDKVTWDWTSHVMTDVTVTQDIDVNTLTQVEKAQVQIGSVGATATTGIASNTGNVSAVDVDTSATAVGNNQNITADTPTFLNDGQFTYGGANATGSNIDPLAAANALFAIDNSHLAFGLGVVAGEALDIITPASISANATTTYTTATGGDVNNNATAVANNTNVNVNSDLLIGDLTQVAVANVSAGAVATNISVTGGGLDNHATAVGNNVNINVGPVSTE